VVLTAVVVGAAAATAVPLVARFAPSEQALVMGAAVRVDMADIASGAGKTVGWRGKPVWIRRRPPEMLARQHQPGHPIPAWGPIGQAAFTALVTARRLIWPGVFSKTSQPRPIWKCRPTGI